MYPTTTRHSSLHQRSTGANCQRQPIFPEWRRYYQVQSLVPQSIRWSPCHSSSIPEDRYWRRFPADSTAHRSTVVFAASISREDGTEFSERSLQWTTDRSYRRGWLTTTFYWFDSIFIIIAYFYLVYSILFFSWFMYVSNSFNCIVFLFNYLWGHKFSRPRRLLSI